MIEWFILLYEMYSRIIMFYFCNYNTQNCLDTVLCSQLFFKWSLNKSILDLTSKSCGNFPDRFCELCDDSLLFFESDEKPIDDGYYAIVSPFLLNEGDHLFASAHDVCRSTSEKKWVFKNNLMSKSDKKLKNTSMNECRSSLMNHSKVMNYFIFFQEADKSVKRNSD